MNKELLVFSAPWCSHCVAMKPRIEEFEKAHEDVAVKYINVDEDMDTARKYKIRSIPALVVLNDGEEAAKHVGELSSAELEKLVFEG